MTNAWMMFRWMGICVPSVKLTCAKFLHVRKYQVFFPILQNAYHQNIRILGPLKRWLQLAQLYQIVVVHHKQTVQRLQPAIFGHITVGRPHRYDGRKHGAPLYDQLRHVHHVLQHLRHLIVLRVRRNELNVDHYQIGIVLDLAGGAQLHDHDQAHGQEERHHRHVPQQPVRLQFVDDADGQVLLAIAEHLQQ